MGKSGRPREEREGLSARRSSLSPSQLFGASVETVVEKFREARRAQLPSKPSFQEGSRSEPEQSGGPGPSWSEGPEAGAEG